LPERAEAAISNYKFPSPPKNGKQKPSRRMNEIFQFQCLPTTITTTTTALAFGYIMKLNIIEMNELKLNESERERESETSIIYLFNISVPACCLFCCCCCRSRFIVFVMAKVCRLFAHRNERNSLTFFSHSTQKCWR